MSRDWAFIWPFPRVRYWLKTRIWCDHPAWHPGNFGRPDGWRMIDNGMRQIRFCAYCEKTQIRP